MLWGFFFSVLLIVAGYFGLRIFLDMRNKAYDRQKIDGYRDRIRRDPNNIGAYEALGDACFTVKRYAEAAEAYRMAVNLGFHSRVVSEQACYRLRLLQQWQAENANPALKPSLPALCQSCGAVNHRSRRTCVECNMPLPADTFAGAFQHADVRRACIESAVALVVFALVVAICTPLPPIGKFMVVMLMGGLVFAWLNYIVDGSRT